MIRNLKKPLVVHIVSIVMYIASLLKSYQQTYGMYMHYIHRYYIYTCITLLCVFLQATFVEKYEKEIKEFGMLRDYTARYITV